MKRFFSYVGDDGFELHDTLDEAKACAQQGFEYDQDNAVDGWPEHTWQTCYGELRGSVVETARMPWNEHLALEGVEPEENPQFDEYVDYALQEFDS